MSEIFEERCPYFMALGMSYHDYWDGDPAMARAYFYADRERLKRRNAEFWLQGAYIYEAILNASPVLNALAKDHKPIPYRSEPISLTPEEVEDLNARKMKNGLEFFKTMAEQANKKFEKKEV